MSLSLATLTISILILTATSMWKTYKEKALLHPGLYFCIIWTSAILSFLYINTFNNKYNVIKPEYVDELHGYILFTAITFLISKNFGKLQVIKNSSIWNVYNFAPVYKIFTILAFLSAIILFIIRGATLDLALNRNNMVEVETLLFTGKESQGLIFTLFGSFTATNLILAILSGFLIGERLRGKTANIINKFYLSIPFITQIVIMIAVGGRNDFIWVLRCYIFGAAISLSNGISKLLFKKAIILCAVIFSMFLFYSNFNIEQRKNNITEIVNWDEQPFVKPFASIVEYFSSVYVGYQLRRDDFVTDKLEYGEKTFAGILFFDIPFAGTMGLKNSSIGEILGLEKYTMKKMFLELQSQNAAWFSTVSSIYLLLFDDFGYYGTFIVIFLFVCLTQWTYVAWFKSPNKSFFSIYFLLLFFVLWSNSIFDPVFATGNVRTLLYSITIIQLSVFIANKMFNKVHLNP